MNENVPTDFSEEGKKVAEEIKHFREIPGKEGDEAFSLMIVGSWKYQGEHFEDLGLTWPEMAQKACQNDVKYILDMFRGSNFLSDPDPDHNTAIFSTIISLNDNEEDLEDKMDQFKAFWKNNKAKKINTRAFVWDTGHGIILQGTIGTQLVLTKAGEYKEFEIKFALLMGKKPMMNLAMPMPVLMIPFSVQ